ncbi:4Fe-4S single cluster domain-containing protein [Streptomyces profundus]|uniref:4Fe-4S single cluster domain-containing protein n=1 Tax=Streptomyces profundus TaxID=2867410 RepID=UPI001D16777F|nr:4Fe-4S single cluster domain-containing protein [Streptomyces sp. MA3_2.13]UED87452.1 radical SAM protein [Streptomyces sp. MA3_2.13]
MRSEEEEVRDGGPGWVARISGVHFPVTVLGPGRRLGIWFQGCPLACAGCMSRHTWDSAGGRAWPVAELLALWRQALAAGAEGLTVSGGEPLAQPAALARLLAGAAGARGAADADLLLYTGYTEAEIAADEARTLAVGGADALVTGRYVAARATDLVWRGSANQRLVPRTPLGAARYAPHLTRRSGPRALQIVGRGGALALYGVPRPGELDALEVELGEVGVGLTDPSWRV